VKIKKDTVELFRTAQDRVFKAHNEMNKRRMISVVQNIDSKPNFELVKFTSFDCCYDAVTLYQVE
jgi:predicted nucleotide-binding protein (sugar kinase/HSP70/actin superfamily)